MQQRFRRGASSIGPAKCDGCDRTMQHGEVYLAIDEKPSDKYKEETVFIDEVDCSECGNKIEEGEHYMLTIEGDSEKAYCHSCLKKKGGETFRKKNSGAMIDFVKSKAISKDLRFCQECCEKRKAGMEKKEKGEKIFSFFVSKTGK
jgi:hypothetical protein